MLSRIFPFGGAASSIKLSDDVRLNNTPFSLLSAFIHHNTHSVFIIHIQLYEDLEFK